MRLQGGLVGMKGNEPKVARHVMRGARRPCVVSMYVGDMFGDMREALIQNKRDYCKAMNYTCKIYENVLKKESRPVAWQKLYALEDSMSACSRLMWVDGDAMFMGHKPMPNPAKEIMMASEKDGVNTGVMVMHSTSWIRGLLRRVSGMHSFDTHDQREQAALNTLLRRDGEISSHVERVDQRDLNSFDMRDAPFIYHTSGLKNKQGLWRKALDSDDYTVKIVTLNTSPNKWCACGIQTIKKYAKKNGYSFEMVTTNIDSVSHPKFQKYYEVLEHFDSDLILLLDCDIAITNHSIRVEDVYNQYKTDMIIARDAQWKRSNIPINSGVIIFRKSDWTTSLLTKMKNAVRSQSEKYLGRWLVDQPVLTHILVNMGELKDRGVTEFEKSAHVSVVSQRVMNSFFRRGISLFKTDPVESIWKHGDWMAHVTGSRGDERLKIMQELGACENKCERICPCYEECIDKFDMFGIIPRPALFNGLVERHRMVCTVFKHKTTPTGNWLYFGPETTHITQLRKQWPNVIFTGIDYFAEGYHHYGKDTLYGDVQNLSNIKANMYDGIIILHVLEHVPSIESAISELYRILKPGGKIIHETPCQNEYNTFLCSGNRHKRPCAQKNHVWGFNCANLNDMMSKMFSCKKIFFPDALEKKYGIIGNSVVRTICTKTAQKTTVVLMGYSTRRKENYNKIFEAYGSMDSLVDKIIFIWNNINESPPHIPAIYRKRIQMVRMSRNSMNNRYNISRYVDTTSVITVDDDVILTPLAIKKMLENHLKTPDLLIGLDERSYTTEGKYLFTTSPRRKLVIGKTMMWNIKYGPIYFEHTQLVDFTDTHPCEDVAMNFLIRSITNQEPIILKSDATFRIDLPEPDGLSLKQGWSKKRNKCVAFMLKYFETENLFSKLRHIDSDISKHASSSKIYGNVFSGQQTEQVLAYFNAVKTFLKEHPEAKHICEIGFAGGHSATIFLSASENMDISYTGFDIWDRPFYEDSALKLVKEMFPTRQINIYKGDSTKTVPSFEKENFCDVIHVDGAHHAHYPTTDYKNMYRLASENNILLIDDCTDSWPAVLKGVDHMVSLGLVATRPEQFVTKEWVHRGSKKGWCIGMYDKPTTPDILFFGHKWSLPDRNQKCSSTSDKCFFNNEYGTASVSCDRWFGAQKTEQVTWDTRNTDVDRNEAHSASFNNYDVLPNDLGHVIEIGSGPFTQTKTIIKNGHSIKSMTLVEPMALHYMSNVKHCFYKNGKYMDVPTTILSMPAEDIPENVQFDTVVMINVLEHVYDAFTLLKKTVELVKPGGIFIWHERTWDTYKGLANGPNDREFKLHPIRIKNIVASVIISLFETMFITYDTNELKRLGNDGVYFIGKRISSVYPESNLLQHTPCFERIQHGETVVLHMQNNWEMKLENSFYNDSIKDIYIIAHDDIYKNLEKYKKKIKMIISNNDQWKSELIKYTKSYRLI